MLFSKILIYMRMDVWSACMYVHCVGRVPMKARECQVPRLELQVTVSHMWVLGTQVLCQEKQMLLTIKPPLQPPVQVLRSSC